MKALLTICLVLSFTMSVFGQYSGGSGTAAAPYKIANEADLRALGANTDDYNKHFIMTADITMTGEPLTKALIAPDIDDTSTNFEGIAFGGNFDGDGHIIKNLTISIASSNDSARQYYLGLFGVIGSAVTSEYVSDAIVSRLGVENVQIISNDNSSYVGGLCGRNNGNINYCYTESYIEIGSAGSYDGVLCGQNSGIISDCYCYGSITGADNSTMYGGFCGISHNEAGKGIITNCYSTSSVSAGTDSSDLGGFCGSSNGTITNCFWDVDQSGFGSYSENNCGAIGESTLGMKMQLTFSSWDFDDIWYIQGGVDYPGLIEVTNHVPVQVQDSLSYILEKGKTTVEVSKSAFLSTVFDKDHDELFITIDPEGPYSVGLNDVKVTVTDKIFPPVTFDIKVNVFDPYGSGLDSIGQLINFQGRLESANNSDSNVYDFKFDLFETLDIADQEPVCSTMFRNGISLTDGIFNVQLNAYSTGGMVFTGEPRWLEISVKGKKDPGYFTIQPRQRIHYSPYAITAMNVSCPIDGDIKKEYTEGNMHSIVPLAMGRVSSEGVILSGTGNYNCVKDNATPIVYEIMIDGHIAYNENYIILAVPIDNGHTIWSNFSSDKTKIIIGHQDVYGNYVSGEFSFIVYKLYGYL